VNQPAAIEMFREKIRAVVDGHALNDAEVQVMVKPLTPEEAIGKPARRDYPIIEGKERVIEAVVLGSCGQAYTDSPACFTGQLGGIVDMPLESNRGRALFLAAANAVLAHLGLTKGTVHCKDEEPEECAAEMATAARALGIERAGLIGLNPAIAEALVKGFGAEHVGITDLNPQNVGKNRFGVPVWDGKTQIPQLINYSDIVVITGTTLVNGTYDGIMQLVQERGKKHAVYGITAAGFCKLMDVERWCFRARDGGQGR